MLIDYQTLVDDYVRDDADKISPAQRDLAINMAVLTYSQAKPKHVVEDVVITATDSLPLPASWETDFSGLTLVEYPIGKRPVQYIPAYQVSVYTSPSGQECHVNGTALTIGTTARINFTKTYALTDSVDEIALMLREPICRIAAANLFEQLAAVYAGDTDSTIQADSVNHTTKSAEYARRARDLRKLGLDALGINNKRLVVASAVVNLDANNSLGRDRLTHPARFR